MVQLYELMDRGLQASALTTGPGRDLLGRQNSTCFAESSWDQRAAAQGHLDGEGDAASGESGGDGGAGLMGYSSILETGSIDTPVSAAKRRLR